MLLYILKQKGFSKKKKNWSIFMYISFEVFATFPDPDTPKWTESTGSGSTTLVFLLCTSRWTTLNLFYIAYKGFYADFFFIINRVLWRWFTNLLGNIWRIQEGMKHYICYQGSWIMYHIFHQLQYPRILKNYRYWNRFGK